MSNKSPKWKNYWLLFKQGFKGVLVSKVQFIVILLLAILSVSLLVSGITSFSRLMDNEQVVFNDTPEFDYDFHYNDRQSDTVAPVQQLIYPLLDLEYAYSYDTDVLNDNLISTNYNLYFAGDNCQGTLFDGIFDPQNTSGHYNNYLNDYASLDSTSFIEQLKNDLFSNLYSAVSTGQVGYKYQGQDHYHDITQMTSESLIYQYFSQIYDPSKTAITDYFFLDNFLQYESTTFYSWIDYNFLKYANTTDRSNFLEQNILGNNQSNTVFSNENTWIGDLKYDDNTNSYHPYTYSEASDDAGGGDPINSYVDDNLSRGKIINQYGLHGCVSTTAFNTGTNISDKIIFDDGNMSFYLPLKDGNQQINNWEINDENYMYFHTKMAAQICNFDFDIRNEIYVSDQTNNFKYRVVLLDNPNSLYNTNNPDVTLMKGALPKNSNQIVISPQFAKSNHWNVGDWISINNKPYQISGIGTDPFAYIPAANNEQFIPDTSTSGVIYISQSAQKQFIPEYSTDSIDSTLETHIFLTTKSGFNSNIMDFSNFLGNGGSIIPFDNENEDNQKDSVALSSFITSFNTSPYSRNWTVFPKLLFIFKWILYFSSAIILVICLISVFISIKKNIEKNSSQIAILKSLGVSNNLISLSYLSYAFVITFFAIPIGWLLGTIFQIQLCSFFDDFFSLDYSNFVLNPLSLLFSFAIVGIIAFITSFLMSMFVLRKPVIDVINQKDEWKQNKTIKFWGQKLINKKSFSANFRVNVVSSSVKNITILSIVIFTSSFIMTLVLSLPSVFTNLSDSFFNDMQYKNEYAFNTSVYNSPLTKLQTNLIQDPNVIENNYSANKGYNYYDENGNIIKSGGYDSLNNYFNSDLNTSPIPFFLFNNKDTAVGYYPKWTVDTIYHDSSQVYSLLTEMFGNNFYSGNGNGFSVGMIIGTLNLIYNYTYNEAIKDGKTNEDAKIYAINKTSQVNDSLSIGIVQILQQILDIKELPSGDNWEDQIVQLVLSKYPDYVKNIVNSSDAKKDQFVFGWNFYNSVYGQDALVTNFNNTFDNNTKITTNGLDQNNNILKLTSAQKSQCFVDSNTINQLNELLNSPNSDNVTQDIFTDSGYKIYDKSTNTILIPTIASPQALIDLGKPKDYNGVLDDDYNISGRQELQYKDAAGNFVPLNKSDWIYDDTDFFHSEYFKTLSVEQKSAYFNSTINLKDEDQENPDYGQSAYLNPFELNNSDFSFKDEYNSMETEKIAENAYGKLMTYSNIDASGTVSYQTVLRPYYEFKNMHLYIPDPNDDVWKLNFVNSATEKTDYSKVTEDNATPPDCVKDASPNASKWVDVKPYDLNFSEAYDPDSALGNFFNSPSDWLVALTYELVNNDLDAGWKLEYNSNPNIANNSSVNIKYNVVDQSETYGSGVLYLDNNLSNLIYGYDSSEMVQTTPVLNDESLAISDDATFANNITSSYSQVLIGTNMWYNTSFSNIAEPIGFTTQSQLSPTINIGCNLVNGQNTFLNRMNASINNMDLLVQKKNFINEISGVFIAFTSFFIIFIVLCSALLVLLISNLFISKYYTFSNQMKTEGYSKRHIMSLTLHNFIPFVFISWALSSLLAVGALYVVNIILVSTAGLVVPFGFDWYNIFITLILIFIVYSFSFVMAYIKLGKNPAESLAVKII
ncbi:ABC transporter permease [Spiroplasma endosymbiont of Amphibalanus improvisus]|uniref:ABC transporter permease n=1 Tax=Spiroplasma endosymbiont of Amphibalanus improvisus TaxID=3066327 RepID=UPI00313C53B1